MYRGGAGLMSSDAQEVTPSKGRGGSDLLRWSKDAYCRGGGRVDLLGY